MFPKPTVPVFPVTVKATAVEILILLEVIVTFDICEFVMFPLIARLIVVPLSDVALTINPVGVKMGVSVTAGAGESVGVGVSVSVGVGFVFSVDVGFGVGVCDGWLTVNTAKVEATNINAIAVRMIANGFEAFANAVS